MPFWFLPIVGGFIFNQKTELLEALRSGELFVYAATLLGPLAYVIHKQYGRFRAPSEEDGDEGQPLSYIFPYGRSFSWSVAICCILSGFVFSLERLEELPQLGGLKLVNESGVLFFSFVIFLFANITLFCVLAYRNMLESLAQRDSDRISRSLPDEESETLQEWLESRNG